jgi:hypothetical protein
MYKRPALDLALALVARRLSTEAVDAVLKTETRERVLFKLVEFNDLEPDQVELLASRKTTKARLASRLLPQTKDANVRRELALRAGENVLLEWLATTPVKEAVARELMSSFSSWASQRGFRERARLLGEVLERFPTLVDVFVAPNQDLSAVTAASSSRFITNPELARRAAGLDRDLGPVELEDRRYALLALVNNPVVAPEVLDEVIARYAGSEAARASANRLERRARLVVEEPFEAVSDPDVLGWLLGRSLPSEYKPAGRTHDLAALALNPNLEPSQRRRVAVALSYPLASEALGTALNAVFDRLAQFDPELEELRPSDLEYSGEPVLEVWTLDFDLFEPSDDLTSRVLVTEPSRTSFWRENMWIALGDVLGESFGDSEEAYETFISLFKAFDGPISDLVEVASGV